MFIFVQSKVLYFQATYPDIVNEAMQTAMTKARQETIGSQLQEGVFDPLQGIFSSAKQGASTDIGGVPYIDGISPQQEERIQTAGIDAAIYTGTKEMYEEAIDRVASGLGYIGEESGYEFGNKSLGEKIQTLASDLLTAKAQEYAKNKMP